MCIPFSRGSPVQGKMSKEKNMKKGQVLTGVVERVDFPNKGIVITPEGICIVKNVLPGQNNFDSTKKTEWKGRGTFGEHRRKFTA